ncbi:MAG: hypothetical protein ACI935_004007, partial [Moritella dasanensis]
MNTDEVNQLTQHYPKIHLLNAEQEAAIATKMDTAMEHL